MPSFTQLTYHIIFGTKHRHPSITPNFRARLHEYLGGTIRAKSGVSIMVGGVADHVHPLVQLPAMLALADVVRDIKANSSGWIADLGVVRGKFAWQKGYAAFTVSFSMIPRVRTYIEKQEEHHRRRGFVDEYIALLVRHGVSFDTNDLFEQEHTG